MAKVDQGLHFNAHLRSLKSFRNPHVLDKLVAHFDIDQYDSAYSRDVWDVSQFTGDVDGRYKALGERIKQWELERAAARSGTRVEFVAGTSSAASGNIAGTGTAAAAAAASSSGAAARRPPMNKKQAKKEKYRKQAIKKRQQALQQQAGKRTRY